MLKKLNLSEIVRVKRRGALLMKFMMCGLMFFLIPGCLLTKMLGGPESPRPLEYQVQQSKDMITALVPGIVKAQIDKQKQIESVASKAINMIKGDLRGDQSEAITNVVANSVSAILRADGTKQVVGDIMNQGIEGVLKMPGMQYLAYSGLQTAAAIGNKERLYEGIKTGIKWSNTLIEYVVGGTGVMGTLVAFAISSYMKSRSKDRVLKGTGQEIEKFAERYKDAGGELKAMLAKAASRMKIDAGKEFGV